MLKLTNVFRKNADAYISGKYRYIINQGGTSASKTFSVLQLLTQIGIKHQKQIDIVGLTVPHLKAGVLNDMQPVMDGFGLNFHSMLNQTDKRVIMPSDGTMNFISIDKLGKAHGGRRDILFLNEANHQHYNIAEQLMIRTREVIFIDYNPTNEFWVHDKILSNPAEAAKAILIKSNYKDNEYLEQSIVDSIEAKRGDGTNNFWRVYGLGELGIAEGLVFDNWEVEEFDKYKFAMYRNGVDWGFSNDPFAFVRVAVEQNTLYICEEIYQRGLLNRDSSALIKPIVRNETVYCDSAEPKSVQEYVSYEIKAQSVLKGPGSLESGIKYMQGFDRIVIHPSCIGAITEFKSYQWKTNTSGDRIAQPIDGFNHCLVPSTLIKTSKGNIPIKDIKAGDDVLTRSGYKKVKFAGVTARNQTTYKVTSANGKSFVATGNHSVLTDKGFFRVDALRYGDRILSLNESNITCKEKPVSMMNTHGLGILNPLGYLMRPILNVAGYICTIMYGKNIMAAVKKECTSTTLTETLQITTYPICSKYLQKSMPPSTSLESRLKGIMNAANTWIGLEILQNHGMRQKKAENGIETTLKTLGSQICQIKNVPNAQTYLNQKPISNGFVATLVRVLFGDLKGLITLNQFVSFAITGLRTTNTVQHLLAADHVQTVTMLGKEPKLYDLTVEGEPEFFANGILVHNCIDAIRYALEQDMNFERRPRKVAINVGMTGSWMG